MALALGCDGVGQIDLLDALALVHLREIARDEAGDEAGDEAREEGQRRATLREGGEATGEGEIACGSGEARNE